MHSTHLSCLEDVGVLVRELCIKRSHRALLNPLSLTNVTAVEVTVFKKRHQEKKHYCDVIVLL